MLEENFYKIDPMYAKEEFLRKAWISLAHEDVPLEVFEKDFSDVNEEAYHILCTGADYDVSWSGEIGNDRIEYYMDVETYYDQEPYTDYEKKYNASTKQYDMIPVTKYRKVEKQRQVQKSRTVTDWHSGNGDHAGTAKSWDCVDARNTFDAKRYEKDVKSDDFVEFDDDELECSPDMQPTDAMLSRAGKLRDDKLNQQLRFALPGDHNRGITYRTNSYTLEYVTMFRVPEYVANITFDGNTYTKRAFACGGMTMSSAKIPNPISGEKEKKRLQEKRNQTIMEAKERLEKQAWAKVKSVSTLAIVVLAASIAASLLIHSLIPMLACFIGGVAMYIFTKITRRNAENTASNKLNAIADEAYATCQDQVENYQRHRNAELLSALNKKLASLGLQPATEAEFNNA